jgi:hypothetical protein
LKHILQSKTFFLYVYNPLVIIKSSILLVPSLLNGNTINTSGTQVNRICFTIFMLGN